MNEQNFIKEVTRIINLIAEIVEEKDVAGEINVDIDGDLLNIETKNGVFVINKQTSAREIWLSSPISGPYHFAYNGGKWLSKMGYNLFEVLSNDLNIKVVDSNNEK